MIMNPRPHLLPENLTIIASHLRFALESPISLNSNGVEGEGDYRRVERGEEEEEEEFSFLVCVCCFLPHEICTNLHPFRPWSDLPLDIVDIIASHLQFADYVRFGAVCKSWRSVTADTPHLRALQHPWLAILRQSALFSPVEDRLYHQNIPFASNSRCIGRSQGCLIFMNESEGGHIFNPFTNQTFKFPSSRYRDFSVKAVLSSAPLRAGAGRDCVLAVFFSWGALGFCRPGDRDLFIPDCTTHWKPRDVAFFKGLLYCQVTAFDYISKTYRHNLLVFEFGPGPGPEMKYTESYVALGPVELRDVRKDGEDPYLAELAGDLLMVVKYWVLANEDARRTVVFGFYKLDFSVPKWVEVETIGDKMLLLDDHYLHCVDAADFSAYGFRPNCIYFTDGELDNYEWRIFSLEDKKIQPFHPTSSWAMRSPLILIKPGNA